MDRLSVKIGNLKLQNPVTTASGTFGYGVEYADFVDLDRLGAIFVKGTTVEPREGNDYPRMAETPSGMLNSVGLQNRGVDYFVGQIYPGIKDYIPISSSTYRVPPSKITCNVPKNWSTWRRFPPSN